MKISFKLELAFIAMLSVCCSGKHLINNSQYRILTEKAFNIRKQLANSRDSALFSVFNQNLSADQSEALKFLYAFMPLNDLADYNGSFFLANVDKSLNSRSETSWGKTIPEDIFLHYVLPYRINNENLDSFRIVFYDELMQLIKGKDISEAALAINHWCHEKVTYQPADIRTSAPMSTILSAQGRCGEESTLTVTALRTAGIPARQVYTPRWAHTDDNHAWVEIWIDGKWYYTGACEPEPVLDRGWFTEPARRAMLVHTKSFGAFSGTEDVINRYADYTDINNLRKYAITKKISVKVIDSSGNPVDGADVEYQLYNYAEFYPLAVVPTDATGISKFETGLGDLLIWAHKDDNFDFKKISVAQTDTVVIKLDNNFRENTSFDLDLDVPVVRPPFPGPSPELIKRNAELIKKENISRQQYINSWMKPAEAKALSLSLKTDSARLPKIISRSMGNYNEIVTFLKETPASLMPVALNLLDVLPDKDLRDVKRSILQDHIRYAPIDSKNNEYFTEYILNPRVANEMLAPWRHYLLTKLPSQLIHEGAGNPSLIVRYINENIKIAGDENYYDTPITPVGVNEIKVSDKQSRAIFFVAICRSLGTPSRLEPGRNVPQYLMNNNWIDVYFSDEKQPDKNKGFIKLTSSDINPVPEYYIHFTLARFEGGRYNTLEYDYNKKITAFTEELPLPPGHYMLVTGNRISDSKILSNISFFDLSENEHKTVAVKIRKDLTEKKILGKIDLKKIYDLAGKTNLNQSCTKHNGMVLIWIEPESEPTKHIFNDLPQLKSEFDAWGGNFLFLQKNSTPGLESIRGLPANTSFITDNQMSVLKSCLKLNTPADMSLPYVVVSDRDGNILFNSSGYRIGIGEEILKYLH